jgi:hypothetical protein
MANQSPASFLPPSSSWRLCSLLCVSGSPYRRHSTSISAPTGHLLCLPRHASLHHPFTALAPPLLLVPRSSATSIAGCQHRPPAFLPPPQFSRRLALFPPLFCSIALVAHTRFICPASLRAQPTPSPFRLRRPTRLSGELWVAVGRHVSATIALTEPSRGSPGACPCFLAPDHLPNSGRGTSPTSAARHRLLATMGRPPRSPPHHLDPTADFSVLQ